MPRQLKGAIVEWVEHKVTHRRAPIRLDKTSMTFWAREYDDHPQPPVFQSKNGGEVRAWLYKQLSHTTDKENLEWVPVVKIEYGGDSAARYRDDTQKAGESLNLEVDRYYLALTRDKQEWRRLRWEQCHPDSAGMLEEKDRYAASSKYAEGPASPRVIGEGYSREVAFQLPHFGGGRYRGHSQEAVVPYTDELWDGLQLVIDQVAKTRSTIIAMVSTKKGLAAVSEIGRGQLLLTAATTTKKQEG